MLEVTFKTPPFKHQLDEFTQYREETNRALLWEQGTGKSKLVLDTVAWLYINKKIDALLIVAPNGVHQNWLHDQFPQHYSGDTYMSLMWDSRRAGNKAFQSNLRQVMENYHSLAVLTINYEAIITKKGRAAVEKFLGMRDVFMVCDESHKIKAMSAIRTKAIIELGRFAKYRRILTGTVVGNSAFDLYSQFLFLNENILGQRSEYAFKQRYGVFVKTYMQGRYFNQLVKYKNLEHLRHLIEPYSSRVTKDDVLDLPAKLYTKRYFYMSDEQKAAYIKLKEEYLLELDTGDVLTAPLAITRMLRLQQISCGYVPKDENSFSSFGTKNPRVECLMEAIESTEGKIIIWARFTEDIRQIKTRLELDKIEFVEYYGDIGTTERTWALETFTQNPDCKIFLANPACAGEGLNLHVATTIIYYSNSFKLIERLQSEDRAHRIGQTKNVTYIDIMCPETIDEHIVQALIDKKDVAALVNGDNLGEWI
jgi:SNF2 family DNA or RNA helicase